MTQSSKDKVIAWLTSAGFIVAPLNTALPSNAEWGLAVSTPPPVQVRLKIFGLNTGGIVIGMGVNFSDKHREELIRLPVKERIRFSATMLDRVLSICPYCRIALQGGVTSPVALIAEILLFSDEITRQRLVDDSARLVNVFLIVNALLWEKFPHTITAPQHSQSSSFI
ncbi:MAG TPA: DUF2299 domain-containing protein [Aigarchaeota archaeon]|nr:DUF2299 domain-containing protein [Aigarchaeota archaeon]